jgi:hypothetical protein
MAKFSTTTGALLILTSLLAGSTVSGSIAKKAASAEAQAGQAILRLVGPARSAQAARVFAVARARPASATDVCLAVILGGCLVALQLRRTQRGVRMARVTV